MQGIQDISEICGRMPHISFEIWKKKRKQNESDTHTIYSYKCWSFYTLVLSMETDCSIQPVSDVRKNQLLLSLLDHAMTAETKTRLCENFVYKLIFPLYRKACSICKLSRFAQVKNLIYWPTRGEYNEDSNDCNTINIYFFVCLWYWIVLKQEWKRKNFHHIYHTHWRMYWVLTICTKSKNTLQSP